MPSAGVSNQLPRQVKLFGAVSLLNDFASEMVYPLLPAFITGVLGGGALALGALDGAADAAAARCADRGCDAGTHRGPRIWSAARARPRWGGDRAAGRLGGAESRR